MKVSQQSAVELLQQLGFSTAGNWKAAEVQKKLSKLPTLLEAGDPEIEDEELLELVERITAEIDEGGKVEIVSAKEAKKPAPVKAKAKPPAKSKKAAEEEEEEEEGEEEEAELEEEEEEEDSPPPKKGKKPEKKKAVAKKDSNHKASPNGELRTKVGIVETIVGTLEKASATKPLSRDRMLDILTKKFPDRDAKGMKHTVYVQLAVPEYGLAKRGYKIASNQGGYFLKSKAPVKK